MQGDSINTRVSTFAGWGAALLLAFPTPTVLAQGTDLGQILDKKPEELSKDQVQGIVSGASLKRTAFNQVQNAYVEVTANFKADGTVAVMQQTMHGPVRGNGKWRVSDEGQLCSEISWPRSTSSACTWFFKLGEELWVSQSDSDRSTFTSKASISK